MPQNIISSKSIHNLLYKSKECSIANKTLIFKAHSRLTKKHSVSNDTLWLSFWYQQLNLACKPRQTSLTSHGASPLLYCATTTDTINCTASRSSSKHTNQLSATRRNVDIFIVTIILDNISNIHKSLSKSLNFAYSLNLKLLKKLILTLLLRY